MRFYDLPTLIDKIINNLAPIAGSDSDDNDGAAIDLVAQGQYHSGCVLCYSGAATGSPTGQSVVFTLEHSDESGANYTAVEDEDGNDLTATLDADNETAKISFRPNELKQYIRVNRVVTLDDGTTPKWPTGAMVLLGHGRDIPS
jgi:hypothetical protein